MGVVRLLDDERAVLHATTRQVEGCTATCREPIPLDAWSSRLRPRPGPIARIEDAEGELDRSFPIDADILDAGVRSALWEPFRSRNAFSGGLWLSSYRAGVFNDEHQELLRPIAALLGSAVEHWRIWLPSGVVGAADRGLLDTLASPRRAAGVRSRLGCRAGRAAARPARADRVRRGRAGFRIAAY
jgi:hypothetical protein